MLKLRGGHVGIPRFAWRDAPASAFLLSSHRRAREALDLALAIGAPGYNVFVLGEDRTGRMTATMTYLRSLRREPPDGASDWIYLYNFHDEAAPRAFRLAAGDGRRFVDTMDKFLWRTRTMLQAALNSKGHRARVNALYRDVDARLASARRRRRDRGEPGRPAGAPDATLDRIERETAQLRTAADERREALDRQTLTTILDDEFPPLLAGFSAYAELREWLGEFRTDILANLDVLAAEPEKESEDDAATRFLERYLVNLLVDHAPTDEGVVVEANPTYDNLFGRIEYKRIEGIAETSFLLIRPGALHRANGGILVLRAESLTRDEMAWRFLKAALRDREIRIEELHRVGSMPITGLPKPQSIPLDVKVVIVGSRESYFRFFAEDTEFHPADSTRQCIEI